MARPGISTKNTEKIPPSLKFWTPRIYPENTEKIPPKCQKLTVFGIFWVFWGYFLGVPIFRPGGYFFRYFLWKFRVGPSRGSVAGGGVLNLRAPSKKLETLLRRLLGTLLKNLLHSTRAGPKGVSTKGVSMKMSHFHACGALYTVVSKRKCQKSP